jgi:hypothetical protein
MHVCMYVCAFFMSVSEIVIYSPKYCAIMTLQVHVTVTVMWTWIMVQSRTQNQTLKYTQSDRYLLTQILCHNDASSSCELMVQFGLGTKLWNHSIYSRKRNLFFSSQTGVCFSSLPYASFFNCWRLINKSAKNLSWSIILVPARLVPH